MYTRGRARPGGLFGIRKLGWLAAASMLALAIIGPASAAAADNAKWFVCKYVGTPGVDETLQSGNNPISVSESAIPVSPVVPGASSVTRRGVRTSSSRTPVRASPNPLPAGLPFVQLRIAEAERFKSHVSRLQPQGLEWLDAGGRPGSASRTSPRT